MSKPSQIGRRSISIEALTAEEGEDLFHFWNLGPCLMVDACGTSLTSTPT